MDTPAILARLPDVHPTSSGWEARCPAHDDRRRSLSVAVGRNNGTVLKCHAGCRTEDILAKIGLTLRDLATPDSWRERRTIVATYDYCDEMGERLFQVVRTDPKDFFQRSPDPTSVDGWRKKMTGVRRVPFHLPQLLDAIAAGRPVWIAEGEKDVIALEKAGFAATCNPGGAGKWLPAFADHFGGATVIVLADKDDAGRKHARDVAAKLASTVPKIVVIEVPDVGGKPCKDAHDYFANGGQPADLDELAAGAPHWTPGDPPPETEPARSPLQPRYTWEQLRAPVSLESNLLGNRFLERGAGLIFFGPSGTGKSIALLQANVEWSAGLDGLRIPPVRPLRIVLIQTEDSLDDVREALDGILSSSIFKADHLRLIEQNLIILPAVPGGGPEDLANLINEAATTYTPDMVSANPLLAWCRDDPTRDLGRILYQHVDPMLKRHRIGFNAAHHTPKSINRDTSKFGAYDWQYLAAGDARVANWPRGMISIEPLGDGLFRFRCVKRWTRIGWKLDRKPVSEWFFKHSTRTIRWEEATPEEIKQAEATEDFTLIVKVLPPPDGKAISRDAVTEEAKNKLKIGRDRAERWLRLAVDNDLAEESLEPTKTRPRPVFRQAAKAHVP